MKFPLNLNIQGRQVIFNATFGLVSVVSKSLCLCCHSQEKPSQDSPSHEGRDSWAWGLAAARKPGVPSLDFFHPQLKLFKTGALGLSKLEFCCLRVEGEISHLSYHLNMEIWDV